MVTPLVSVVLPTYNRARTLRRAIDSVLRQTFVDLELIIVNDASTDDTLEVVRGVGDERIVLVSHETRRGGAAARNSGIRIARGEYIAFQDSDDEWMVGKLEAQVRRLMAADSRVAVVFSRFVRLTDRRAKIIPPSVAEMAVDTIPMVLRKGNVVSTQTMLVRKSALVEVGGFDESLPRFQDWDLAIRLSLRHGFLGDDDLFAVVYDSSDSITMDVDAAFEAVGVMIEKYGTLIGDKNMMAELHYQRARYATGKYRSQARQAAARAVRLRPTNLKYVIYYLMLNTMGARASSAAVTSLVSILDSVRQERRKS